MQPLALIESMSNGLAVQDREGVLTYVNPGVCRMLGYQSEELVGRQVAGLIDKRCADVWRRQVKLRIRGHEQPYELSWRCADGRALHTIVSPRIIYDQNGGFDGSFAIITDISDRRRMEDKLRLSEEMFSKAFRLSPNGICLIAMQDARILDINQAAARLAGLERTALIGRSIYEHGLFLDLQEPMVLAKVLKRLRQIRNRELKISGADGQLRTCLLAAEIIDLWSEPCVLVTLEDITERMRLENELMYIGEREKSNIGQALHDDLCPHLIGTEVLCRVLMRRLSDPELACQAGEIGELITQAIDKARGLSRGLCPVSPVDHGLEAALRDLARTLGEVFGTSCRFSCDGDVLIDDNSLATHLFYIAQEAAYNSIKHGRGTMVEIELYRVGEQLKLVISDDGCGLSDKAGAGGMGLSIMRHRARMLGGKLLIRSGGGTVVSCTLQLKREVDHESS